MAETRKADSPEGLELAKAYPEWWQLFDEMKAIDDELQRDLAAVSDGVRAVQTRLPVSLLRPSTEVRQIQGLKGLGQQLATKVERARSLMGGLPIQHAAAAKPAIDELTADLATMEAALDALASGTHRDKRQRAVIDLTATAQQVSQKIHNRDICCRNRPGY